jgi:acetyl esterase/lipase
VAIADFHPDLRRIAAVTPRRSVHPRTLGFMRRGQALMDRRRPAGVEVLTLPSGVGIRLHRPPSATGPAPALLWIHGGGFVLGSASQDDRGCRRIARELGITVAAVDYRLAPEHPFPAPVEDCYAALRWLATLPAVDSGRIAIAGASAGGGLAALLALWARDRGEIDLAAQVLLYPMLDDRTSGRTDIDNARFRLWNQNANHWGWQSFLGDADPAVAVPGRREDLSGLPHTWIGVGTHDLFHDEDLAYAERLNAAGVPAEVLVVPGAFHGFDQLAPKAGVTRSFVDAQCASLRAAGVHS